MPTDPTARDVETARALSPCEDADRCGGTAAMPEWQCLSCLHADAIARALATARAEEREACAVTCLCTTAAAPSAIWDAALTACAAAIRAARSAS